MAAVVGPVRIQYADLRHGRIAFFLMFKVIAYMKKILKRHGKI